MNDSEEESTMEQVELTSVERTRGASYAKPESPRGGDARRKSRESVLADGYCAYFRRTSREIFFGSKMNVLLVFLPPLLIFKGMFSDGITFALALLSLIPLAERISFTTEELAKYTNDTLGGLLNATMGNATEVIVSIFALRNGLIRVVQVSLLGSIFSNLLLVLGTAFVVGGLRHKTQKYNKSAATVNVSLLLLGVMGLMFVSVLHATHNEANEEESRLALSRFCGVLMLCVYGLLIVYQLKTHTHVFESGADEDDEEEDEPTLGFWGAVAWSSVLTLLIAVVSEIIVDVIEGAASDSGIPLLFIGTILLPIVGNAAEHASAIIFAYRNKCDIAMGIAVGSATQITLFVIPLCIVLGWAMGQPMSLDFHIFETSCLFITVVLVSAAMQNGDSDWLKGVVLLMAYALLSFAFWVHA